MYFNALQQQNFTDENLALHVIIAAIFTKVCRVFSHVLP